MKERVAIVEICEEIYDKIFRERIRMAPGIRLVGGSHHLARKSVTARFEGDGLPEAFDATLIADGDKIQEGSLSENEDGTLSVLPL